MNQGNIYAHVSCILYRISITITSLHFLQLMLMDTHLMAPWHLEMQFPLELYSTLSVGLMSFAQMKHAHIHGPVQMDHVQKLTTALHFRLNTFWLSTLLPYLMEGCTPVR